MRTYFTRLQYGLCVLCLLLCVSCVEQTKGVRDVAETQLSVQLYEPIPSQAKFIVQLQAGATHLVNGERVPIRLDEALRIALDRENLLFHENQAPGKKYALVVEKQSIARGDSGFSQTFSQTLEKMQLGEGFFMVEVSVEEIVKNAKGEEIFGKRVGLFSTPLQRSQDDIAFDIVRALEEHMGI